jgi:DNA-binding LytR/AlgR family response regulator
VAEKRLEINIDLKIEGLKDFRRSLNVNRRKIKKLRTSGNGIAGLGLKIIFV